MHIHFNTRYIRLSYFIQIIYLFLSLSKNKNSLYVKSYFQNKKRLLFLGLITILFLMSGCAVQTLTDPETGETVTKLIYSTTTFKEIFDTEESIISFCKKLEVIAPEGFSISVDGELREINKFTCEIVPAAIKFAAPGYKPEGYGEDEE
mgnify:CR=1 FL=1